MFVNHVWVVKKGAQPRIPIEQEYFRTHVMYAVVYEKYQYSHENSCVLRQKIFLKLSCDNSNYRMVKPLVKRKLTPKIIHLLQENHKVYDASERDSNGRTLRARCTIPRAEWNLRAKNKKA